MYEDCEMCKNIVSCDGDYHDDVGYCKYFIENKIKNKKGGDNMLNIEFDTSEMVADIRESLKEEISAEIKSEIINEIKKGIVEITKKEIEETTVEIVENCIKEIYENEIIEIKNGWNTPSKTYTLKQYVLEQVKDTIENNKLASSSYSSKSFREWFTECCVNYEIEEKIKGEIKNIRYDINSRIKDIFEKNTKDMLSNAVMTSLMASETYQKLESSIENIANK